MIVAILVGTLALAAPQQQTDTTFAVRSGGTLQLDAHGGRATVRSWDRDAIRIVASHAPGTDVRIRHTATRVQVESASMRAPTNVQYEITVPRRFDVRLEGVRLEVTVEAVQGSVEVDNVEGAITVRGVVGSVDVESVSGRVLIENVRGPISTSTVNQTVTLTGVTGSIDAETVNGSIVIRAADSNDVRASTVNGLVEYDGTVQDGGRYRLATHNGRLSMSLPERSNAAITIETNSGKVEAEFPVQLRSLQGRDIGITLGTGSARVELETFNGTVYLVRPRGR